MSLTREKIAALAADAGIRKVRMQRGQRAEIRWQVACACGRADDRSFAPDAPPDFMVRVFRNNGWLLHHGSQPLCPDCHRKPQAKETAPVAQQPTPAQLGPSPKISRAVFAMLETHFDEKSGRYNSGWSDERIAKEAATAVDLVVRMRVEAYGELAEDPKITELRDEIELLRMEIEEASKAWSQRLDALQRRADDLGQRRKLAG